MLRYNSKLLSLPFVNQLFYEYPYWQEIISNHQYHRKPQYSLRWNVLRPVQHPFDNLLATNSLRNRHSLGGFKCEGKIVKQRCYF